MEVFELKKGQKKRIWTKEQKLAIIKRYYEEHVSAASLAEEYEADKSMICRWIRNYNQYGESVFDSKNSGKGNKEYIRNQLQEDGISLRRFFRGLIFD